MDDRIRTMKVSVKRLESETISRKERVECNECTVEYRGEWFVGNRSLEHWMSCHSSLQDCLHTGKNGHLCSGVLVRIGTLGMLKSRLMTVATETELPIKRNEIIPRSL